MTYYNRTGEKLNLDTAELTYLNKGCCAEVWHDESIIFKKYFSYTQNMYRLDPKVFKVLKSLNNPHMIEIFDIYSESSLLENVICRLGLKKFIVDAYVAKYYPDNKVNVLYENVDYILDNFREIEMLFDQLADHRITTWDVRQENCIPDSDDIILIDPDAFSFSDIPKEAILVNNKKKLWSLFKGICYYSLKGLPRKQYEQNNMYKKELALESDINVAPTTDVTYEISKKLQYVKRPIDYFMK